MVPFMHWEDIGIILSVKKFSERDALVTLLTREHGVWRSVAKGAFGRTSRATFEAGNLVFARWNARLAEQMGTVTCELLEATAAALMQRRLGLYALSSVCTLAESVLHERDPHHALFEEVRRLLVVLAAGEAVTWEADYVRFERDLLRESGFGLDLSCCAATGVTDDLVYISPKTGRAVSKAAGLPYHERMLPLPPFLRDAARHPDAAELLDGLRVCGYFLNAWLYEPRGRKLPASRERLVERIVTSCVSPVV